MIAKNEDGGCSKTLPLRLCVVDIRQRGKKEGILRAREQTWRNLNESKVPTSLLLKLVSQRERNRVFSSMLLDRVSDGFVVDTETRIYTVDPLNATRIYCRPRAECRCNFVFLAFLSANFFPFWSAGFCQISSTN